MDILSTGLLWDEDKILSKYKILNRYENIIEFDLFYYPYWVLEINSTIHGKFLKDRTYIERVIVNGKTGKAYRIVNEPELETVDDQNIMSIMADFGADMDTAMENGCELHDKHFEKKFNHPLRPRIEMTLGEIDVKKVYKPFWIINNGKDLESDKILVVDGTTGIAGITESGSIIDSWKEIKKTIQTRVF